MSDRLRRDERGEAMSSSALVRAVCHEVGNLLAAVRLRAHLLGEPESSLSESESPRESQAPGGPQTPAELAASAIEIDDACARAGALLATLGPLVEGAPCSRSLIAPAVLVSGLRDALEDHGGRGARLAFELEPGLPEVETDAALLHSVLLLGLYGAVEAVDGRGLVALRARREAGAVAFEVADDGDAPEDVLAWRSGAPRGRSLVCALTDAVAGLLDGRLEVGRVEGRTRLAVVLPAVSALADPAAE